MRFLAFIYFAIVTLVSCNERLDTAPHFNEKIVDTLIRSEDKYRNYSRSQLNFNESSEYFDEDNKRISKLSFFREVYQNSFFPLHATNSNKFKLIKVNQWPNEYIYSWVYGQGFRQFARERLVGRRFLSKGLYAMDGTMIDSNYLKNKLVIVNCWFINCVPCVAEMPQLNEIVERSKNKKNILFLSLAYNKKIDLEKFLSEKEFKYTVIPTYKIPEIDSLGITSFPTHLVVKNNCIQEVIDRDDILEVVNKY